MPVLTIDEFAQLKAQQPRLMALDVGTRTIGLAVCDPDWNIASPLDTIRRTKFSQDMAALERFCHGRAIGGFVIGLPLDLEGREGPRAQSIRQFARNLLGLERFKNHPILLWDERFSTQDAENQMIEHLNLSRAKRKTRIDMMAAQIFLQDFLNFVLRNNDLRI